MLKLKLIQPSEKVRLIFMVVYSTKKMKHPSSIFFLIFFNSSIVTGRNLVKTLSQSSLQKNIKLDQRITKYIWIRSNTFLISCINIVNNSLLILFLKVKRTNLNPQKFRNLYCINRIIIRSTVSSLRNVVFHKTSDDLMSLLLQKIRRDSTIYAS